MLLSSPEQIEHYHSSGLWGDLRLDQIFAAHAKERSDELALIDDQDLHAVTGRMPQCLSFGRAWRRAVALSEFLSGIGMKPDTVVALLLPPSVDAAIVTLAASRMGYLLAPIPLTCGEAKIRERLEQVGAKAIICCSHYEDQPVAERARNVAADMFSIRFVFSIGDGAPEGLIELQSVLDEESAVDEDSLFDIPAQPSADSAFAIHWISANSVPSRPVARNHNQLLCVARQVHEQTDLEQGDCLMVAHHLSGLVGFCAGLVAGLVQGARLQFHHFRTIKGYSDAFAEYGGQHAFLPNGQWEAWHSHLSMGVREQLKSISLVWNRLHSAQSAFCENETAARLLDVTNFSDLALFSQLRRHPGEVGSIPLGGIAARSNPDADWMETHLFGIDEARALAAENADQIVGGELCLKGAMIPDRVFPVAGAVEGEALRATDEGFVHLEIGCHLVTEEHGEERAMFRPLGDLSDVMAFGGLTERGSDLDDLFKGCDGVLDAAAFLMPDLETGSTHLMAALVVEDKETAKQRFFDDLKMKHVNGARLPHDVIFVEAIPRQTNGRVQRQSLLAALDVAEVA